MHTDSNPVLVDRLARYDELVEVGIGDRHGVAAGLAARGRRVTATDVHDRDVPSGVRFVRDDVTDPDDAVYRPADAVYALHCPPELQRPLLEVAARAGADCLFTTLGGDPIVVDATPETLSAPSTREADDRSPQGATREADDRPPQGATREAHDRSPQGATREAHAADRPPRAPPGPTLFSVEP